MPKPYKTALVTGGAGFIGSHIADALIARRMKVYIIDDLSTGKRRNLHPKAVFYKMSVTNPKVGEVIREVKPDIIIHAAAQQDVRASVNDPRRDAKVNIFGTLNLLDAAVDVKVRKSIFLTTGGAMYPNVGKPPFSEKIPADPMSPYAIAKLACEYYFRFYFEQHGLPYTALRLANVYGPRQDSSPLGGVISIFANKLLSEEQVTINGDGKQTRDYVFVEDVVNAVLLAIDSDFVGVCNIGTGKQTCLVQLFRLMNKLTRAKAKENYGKSKQGEVMKSALDASLAKKVLGWKPQMPLEEGVHQTLEWFEDFGG